MNVDIIAMEHDLADYKVLAAPMAYMFKDGYEEKLRAYVENGGTLVLSYWSGLVDGTDRCFLGGTPYGLMDAAGIRSTEIDALYDWEENHAIPEKGSHLGISNGLKSPVEFIPEGVSVTVRESEDTEYLFIQNYARKPQTVAVPAEYELLYGTESEVMAPLQIRILKKSK